MVVVVTLVDDMVDRSTKQTKCIIQLKVNDQSVIGTEGSDLKFRRLAVTHQVISTSDFIVLQATRTIVASSKNTMINAYCCESDIKYQYDREMIWAYNGAACPNAYDRAMPTRSPSHSFELLFMLLVLTTNNISSVFFVCTETQNRVSGCHNSEILYLKLKWDIRINLITYTTKFYQRQSTISDSDSPRLQII